MAAEKRASFQCAGRRNHRRASLRHLALALALPALLQGCAGRGDPGEGDEPPPNVEIAVEIENHNWSDVVIYLVRGTSTERLGMVGSLRTETFIFPFRRLGVGDVRLRAYPIGGPAAFTSEHLAVQPGQMVKWTLESDLTRSFLGIY
jgi:hypothetical protein